MLEEDFDADEILEEPRNYEQEEKKDVEELELGERDIYPEDLETSTEEDEWD